MAVITVSSPKVVEGRTGSSTLLRFTVTLSAPAAQQVSIDYTTTDSAKAKNLATAGTDYTTTAGTLKLEIGQVISYIDVPVAGDNTVEGEEGLDLVLSNAVGASLGKDATLTGTGSITDDEPTLTLAVGKVDEGAAETGGKLRFTATLSAAATETITVDYATADGAKDPATAGSDYTATSGTLTLTVGKKLGFIDVPILVDALAEKNETFTLTLSNAVGVSLGKAATLEATGTITDDESANGGSGTLSISNTSSYEGDTLYFTVALSSPTSNAVTVSYIAANSNSKAKTGLAKQGADFQKISGTLTFEPGETAHVVAVPTTDDKLYEGKESFDFILSNPKGAKLTGGGKTLTATGSLLDNEPTISAAAAELYEPIAPADGSALADNLKYMQFAVSLSEPSSNTVTVAYSPTKNKEKTGAASTGSDFASGNGTLSFSPGTVTAYAYVRIYDDNLAEGKETFNLVLSKPVGAGFSGGATSVTVVGTILDNEPAVIL